MAVKMKSAAGNISAPEGSGESSVPPLTPPPRGRWGIEIAPKTLLHILLFGAGMWVVIHLFPAVLVVVVALFVVGTLNPLVEWLMARKLIVVLTAPALVSQFSNLIDQEPVLRAQLIARLGHSRFGVPLAESLQNFHIAAAAKATMPAALAYSMSPV